MTMRVFCRRAATILMVLLLGGGLFVVARIAVSVYRIRSEIAQLQMAMRQPAVYQPLADTLALYCQTDPTLVPQHIDYAWLPTEVIELKLAQGGISPDMASVVVGGSMYNFGYNLQLNKTASTREVNVWDLYMYSESQSADQLLCTVQLPKERQLSAKELLTRVIAGYDYVLAKYPKSRYALRGKIEANLRFNTPEGACDACGEVLKQAPDYWWAVLVNALVRSAAAPESSEQLIVDWVNRSEDYFRYMDLAYYYERIHQPKKAAEAMHRAIAFNPTCDGADRSGEHTENGVFRGYSAAVYAFESKEYAVAADVCKRLLACSREGDYYQQALQELKGAAERGLHGQPVTFMPPSGLERFDPFAESEIDIDKVLGKGTAENK